MCAINRQRPGNLGGVLDQIGPTWDAQATDREAGL